MRVNTGVAVTIGALLMGATALLGQSAGAANTDGPSGNFVVRADNFGSGPQTLAFVAGELGGSPVKGAPYSAQATTETTQTLADGNQIVNTNTANVYRDAEGRERREEPLPFKGPNAPQDSAAQMVLISDPVAGVNYSLNTTERVAMKMPVGSRSFFFSNRPSTAAALPLLSPPTSDAAAATSSTDVGVATKKAMLDRRQVIADGARLGMMSGWVSASNPQNPPVVEQLGVQTIQGVQAKGTRTTITIPAGQIGNTLPIQIVDEEWRSPELQVIVQSTHSDPRMGTTTYTLNNISRSDPSPSLFQVPSDYTIKDVGALKLQLDKKMSLQVPAPQE